MTINQKFRKALDLQDQGIDRREIFKELEYQSIDALTKMMKKFGYRYDKEQEKYIQVDQIEQRTNGGQVESDEKVAVTRLNKMDTVIDLKSDSLKGNIIGLANHYDEIMNLLTWYKTFGDNCPTGGAQESQIIEIVNQGIQINLPKVKSIKTSIRVNKDIWSEFGSFAELHGEFAKGDLLAQALKEYMKKHS